MATRQFSSHQEHYPSRGGGTLGADRKAATALVFQDVVAGVASTVAIQGDDGSIIASQAFALNTDQIIINAAIVYVNGLGGGSVFVDEGTYTLGANVAVLALVYLYGSGCATILTIPAATDDCIEVNGVTDWKIAFMTLLGTGAGANDVIMLTNADDGEIFSVHITDSGQDGISLFAASDHVNIHDNNIMGCARYGINNRSDDNHFIGNRIDTTGDDGIFLQAGGTNCICALNRISGWTGEAIDNNEPSSEVAHNQLIV